jgi:hypothetical protein
MGFLDTLRSWFSREADEARDLGQRTRSRVEADLERREAELSATPGEKLDMIQRRIAEGDAGFDELRDRVEGRIHRADAQAEMTTAEVGDLSPVEPSDDLEPPAEGD